MKIGFGFMDEARLRKLSVVKVTEVKAFDSDDRPVVEGLYDRRMGPSERRDGKCPTCGFDYVTCPGHLGHVELAVPVYNPLVSNLLPKILGLKCFDCHRFKLKESKVKTFRVKLMLVEAGLLKEADALQGGYRQSSEPSEKATRRGRRRWIASCYQRGARHARSACSIRNPKMEVLRKFCGAPTRAPRGKSSCVNSWEPVRR